jgi:pimeloyl-ACP methyl ester carboxylesterase
MNQSTRIAIGFGAVTLILAGAVALVESQLPVVGAGALLYPSRTVMSRPMPQGCVEQTFAGLDVELRGWRCAASAPRRGTIIYLHGIADNRASATGVVERFVRRGFDVIAYDSRAHGASAGTLCTYGVLEKQDLHRVMDQAGVADAVLIGHSLGAAVALQAAAGEPRVRAVVAASTFADLRSIAIERAPSFFSERSIAAAFARTEHDGGFSIDAASPLLAAAQISAPVLVIHGRSDTNTRSIHSQRVYDALNGPKQLMMVPDAGHNDVLSPRVWSEIEKWIEEALRRTRI